MKFSSNDEIPYVGALAQSNPYRLSGAFACNQKENSKFCVSSEVRTEGVITIRVVTVARGWVAFGPGSTMANADTTVHIL